MKKIFVLLSMITLSTLVLTGVVIAEEDDTESDSTVNVSVNTTCLIGNHDFRGPGNTSTDIPVMGLDETGAFDTIFFNYGNADGNVTVWLNVTKEDDVWEPGESIGNATDLSKQNTSSTIKNNSFYTTFNMSENTSTIYNSWKTYIQWYQSDSSYGTGNFTGRMYLNYSCQTSNEKIEKEIHFFDYANFIVLDVPGESGGVNTTGNQTAPPVPENVNRSGDSNATIGNQSGNSTTDVTQPENYSETGNQTVNQTYPFPGNSEEPGQTEVPVPEPEPEPEPTPGDSPEPGQSDTPRIQIDVEPVNQTYEAPRGQFAPAALEVENIGESSVSNVQLIPEIAEIRDGWQVRNAEIANLSVNETVTRDVFVRPPENQRLGRYLVPVTATDGENRLDLDYFSVQVKRSEFDAQIAIREAPGSVTVTSNSSQPLPILIQNNGRKELTNITAEFQNAEDCGEITSSSVDRIGVNESASLNIQMEAASTSQTCNSTLIVSSDQGAYAFSNVEFTVSPEEGLIPRGKRAPFIAILWTLILAAYAVLRKRYELTSPLLKIPFILLLAGETVILLYMTVNYYGVLSVSFLPF